MAWADQLEETLQFRSTMDELVRNEQASTEGISRSLGYNSFFKRSGSPISPAKWRMQICGLTNRLLTEGCVPGTILSELQKYLNTERYGFNGDIVILLAQHNAPVNALITFRGAQCTLLHGVASVCGSCPLTQSSERFHRYLVRNQPILDIEDEYGRTALAIAVWNASSATLNVNEVHFIRCSIEFGFSPLAEYRGISVLDKLSKLSKALQPPDGRDHHRHQTTAAQYFFDLLQNITFYRLRIEAIHSSLMDLIHRQIIVLDVANVIMDCVGISHFQRKPLIHRIPRRLHRSSTSSKFQIIARRKMFDDHPS